MAYLMMDVLKKHDRRRFEVYAYSYGPPDDSPERRQFMESVDRFVDVQNLTDGEAAERIHEDGIHILIDRKGYTYGARLGIFAARPAPIQVNYLAYGGTMALRRSFSLIVALARAQKNCSLFPGALGSD